MGARTWGWWGLLTAVVLGAVLRLAWVMDMEYKGDEAWTFEQTQEVARTGKIPLLGVETTTVKVCNPGMSFWVFVGLSQLSGAREPTTLARGVQVLNILALVLLVLFAVTAVPRAEREPWLWAAALAALNPLAVVFHRKIWPPSVLPIFALLMLMAWWYRERRWGGFVWGLVGALLGQIHMPGFFFAAGFVVWALLFDRKRVAWGSWFVGSSLGALAMVPWLEHMLSDFGQRPVTASNWKHLLEGKFWIRWVSDPLGLSLNYCLEPDYAGFLAYPTLFGRPTHLMQLLQGVLVVVGVALLAGAGGRLWRERQRLRDLWIGRDSDTAFTQNAALWGFGVLLTISTLSIHRHYLLVTFPLEFLWLARLALPRNGRPELVRLGRALLVVLCLTQLALSASFLRYIHVTQGTSRGDYGIAYQSSRYFGERNALAP